MYVCIDDDDDSDNDDSDDVDSDDVDSNSEVDESESYDDDNDFRYDDDEDGNEVISIHLSIHLHQYVLYLLHSFQMTFLEVHIYRREEQGNNININISHLV